LLSKSDEFRVYQCLVGLTGQRKPRQLRKYQQPDSQSGGETRFCTPRFIKKNLFSSVLFTHSEPYNERIIGRQANGRPVTVKALYVGLQPVYIAVSKEYLKTSRSYCRCLELAFSCVFFSCNVYPYWLIFLETDKLLVFFRTQCGGGQHC